MVCDICFVIVVGFRVTFRVYIFRCNIDFSYYLMLIATGSDVLGVDDINGFNSEQRR